MLVLIIGPFLVLVVQKFNFVTHFSMQLALNYSGKNDHNFKFRGNGVGLYQIRSSSPSNSIKYLFLHNFQGILKLRGCCCLSSRQSIYESCRNKICFRKTKVMSLYCPIKRYYFSLQTLQDAPFNPILLAGYNGGIGMLMGIRKSFIKNSDLK